MGRLFWKFFFFFFLAQMTSIMGVSLIFWLNSPERNADRALATLIEDSPPARTLVDAAAGTLEYGGEQALKKLLLDWQGTQAPQVYAMDDIGQELLGRDVATSLKVVMAEYSDDDSPSVRRISSPEGRKFMLFVPARAHPPRFEPPNAGGPPPEFSSDRHDGPPPIHEMQRTPPKKRMFPFWPMVVGTFASLIFAGLLAWYFSKPIKSLRNAFDRAALGDLQTNAASAMGSRNDELADLGRGFDQMTSKLDALVNGQKRLLHYVSHEIRSPLARLQVAIGLARQSPEKMSAGLERIELEANRMDVLLGDVLELSRLESGVMGFKKERFVFADMLATLLEDARFEAEAKHLDVSLSEDADYEVDIQPDLFYRALENLVRNAIKYSPEQGSITISTLLETEGKFSIVIADEGAGIPEQEMAQVFKPFYRAAEDTSVTGHGMGLAISKQIIDMHGGSISLQNIQPTGLQAKVTLAYVARKQKQFES